MASELGITNGHAARMRFSRFKQHMEGVPSTPRKPRNSVARPAKMPKVEKAEVSKGGREEMNRASLGGERRVEPRVKPEPGLVDSSQADNGVRGTVVVKQVSLSSLALREAEEHNSALHLRQESVLRPPEPFSAPRKSSFGSPDVVVVKIEDSGDD